MNFLYRLFIKNYEDVKNPEVIKKYGLLTGITGIVLNILLFVVKLIVSLITMSVSIISDAFNNLSDASSSIVTLVGFKMSSKPADREHPYGHERVEYISAFIISFIIIFISIELGMSSFDKIFSPVEVDFNYILMFVLFLTILIKLWMGIFYFKTSKKIKSLTLKASAKDSFNDVITTFVIMLGLIIGKFLNINVDGYLGAAVSVYIFIQGIGLIKETITKLIGGTPDSELINKVKKDILRENKILGVHDVLYHCYGISKIYMSLHVEVDSAMSLIDAHELIDALEKKIKKEYAVELVIHIDPILLNDELYNKINNELLDIIKKINDKLSFHDLKIETKKSKSIISFDLLVPFDFELDNDQIYNLINKELKNIDDNYKASINFDNN